MALSCPKSSSDPLPPTLPIKEWHSLLLTVLEALPSIMVLNYVLTLFPMRKGLPSGVPRAYPLSLLRSLLKRHLHREVSSETHYHSYIIVMSNAIYFIFLCFFFPYSYFLSSQESKLHKNVGLDCFQYQTHSRYISNIYWWIQWIFKEKTMLVYFSECVTLIFLTFSESPDV